MEPESWVGQQVSVYLDARGSGETKAIGVLKLIDDTGVVIEEDEEIIAYCLLSLEIHLGDQGGRARGAESGKGRPWAMRPTDRRCRRANTKKWSPRTYRTEP
jgi:hypothetical protein